MFELIKIVFSPPPYPIYINPNIHLFIQPASYPSSLSIHPSIHPFYPSIYLIINPSIIYLTISTRCFSSSLYTYVSQGLCLMARNLSVCPCVSSLTYACLCVSVSLSFPFFTIKMHLNRQDLR